MNTKQRIKRIWSNNGHNGQNMRRRTGGGYLRPRASTQIGGELTGWAEGMSTYSGSDVTNTSSDFLGDWRSADSWMRFDMWRVRNRSRQLERGNPWCIAFKRNILNNVLGSKGFAWKPDALTNSTTDPRDNTVGEPDVLANSLIKTALDEFGLAPNFTTRKKLDRNEFDRLVLARLMFDGEVIIRKLRGFNNDFGFTWQMINPDYLDQNLNRVEPNGNITKLGVELDAVYKFPVAYWFLKRRPNDFFYNYAELDNDRYFRVPAEEIFHIFISTEDDEQTRGWPWIFAAVITLFRTGKYEESALVNAAIGASRGVYYEKELPEGFTGDPKELWDEDDDVLTLDLPNAGALELPVGVSAKVVDMKYPDAEYKDFHNSMLLTTGAVFGTSYATTTGDLSQANFVSSRLGQIEEHENYMYIQQFMINRWKLPGYDEEVYRGCLARKINLPISKIDKFKSAIFKGRRWKFVQPVDDMRAKEMQLDNLTTSVSDIIEETSQEEPEEVFKRISKDNELMKKYGLTRVSSNKAANTDPNADEPDDGTDTGVPKKKVSK